MHEQLYGAMDEIRQAAVQPELLPSAMARLSSIFGCVGALMEPEDPSAHMVLPATESLREFVAAYLRDGWYKDDVRRERRLKRKGAPIVLDQELITPRETQSLPLYQELLKPFGLGYCASLSFGRGDRGWSLSLQRAAARGPFEAEDVDMMRDLVPHLQQSGATALQLAARHDHGIMNGLVAVDAAAVLIGIRREVLSYTPRFARFIDNGLCVRNRRLATELPRQDRRLQELIDSCVRTPTQAAAPQRIQIMRGAGKRPLIAFVAPLARTSRDVFSEAVAVLTVRDPGEPVALPEDILTAQYALTKAEIRLAERLAGGASLAGAACSLEMSYQTARTHLKQIFSKLDVHKQCEMVALLRGFAVTRC